jgi:hypothetical protein
MHVMWVFAYLSAYTKELPIYLEILGKIDLIEFCSTMHDIH